jgi:hypothetical protein
LGSFTAEYEAHLERQKEIDPSGHYDRFPGGQPVDTWAEDEEPFDPDAVPTYYGKQEDHRMIPALEKFLKQFEKRYGEDDEDVEQPAFIWVDHGFGGDPITINFVSMHEPTRKRTFPDMRALERWVMAHKASIQRWYDLHTNEASRVTDRILPKVTRSVLGLIRMVLQARETGQELDEQKLEELAEKIYDASWYIENEEVKKLFRSLVYDIKRPNLRQFITDYHLEWLPERIRELTATVA